MSDIVKKAFVEGEPEDVGHKATTRHLITSVARGEREPKHKVNEMLGEVYGHSANDLVGEAKEQFELLKGYFNAEISGDERKKKKLWSDWNAHVEKHDVLIEDKQMLELLEEVDALAADKMKWAEKKKKESLGDIEEAVSVFQDRDHHWSHLLLEGMELPQNLIDVKEFLSSPHGEALFVEGVMSFGGIEVEAVNGLKEMLARDESGKIITDKLSRSFRLGALGGERERELFPSFHGGADSVFEFKSIATDLDSSFSDSTWPLQLCIRQEDFLGALSAQLMPEEKANVVVSVEADGIFDRYFWMTQGYRYGNNYSREMHLGSLLEVVEALLGGKSLRLNLRDEGGEVVSVGDLKVSSWELSLFGDFLENELEKSHKKEVHNDELVEPWEILSRVPVGDVAYLQDPLSSELVPCSFAQSVMMNASGWDAIKHVNLVSTRDRWASRAADMWRSVVAYEDGKRERPWMWLGRDVVYDLKSLSIKGEGQGRFCLPSAERDSKILSGLSWKEKSQKTKDVISSVESMRYALLLSLEKK